MSRTASSKAGLVASVGFWTPLTFRTYWMAAASISVGVASGSRPRSVVMFRHMPATLQVDERDAAADERRHPAPRRDTGLVAETTRRRRQLHRVGHRRRARRGRL